MLPDWDIVVRLRRAFGIVPSFRQMIVGTLPFFPQRVLGGDTQSPLSFSGIGSPCRV